ncbi:hypothetical protein AUR66_19780 [Haloferax profundi]|uniref:MmgE/PrpD C-terminal domain-containing protein n=2 Tax=Haloferax profundi TaxID=1544718 RepID=A0A0W1RG95_9EURY|nr:hypothetical protein AUR66_19780 [Haloferax profundi]
MTKPLHAGHAAKSGVTAALLAQDGFTAGETAVGTEGGFLDLFSGSQPPVIDLLPDLGTEWGLLEHGIEMKKYPCCSFTHSGIAATNEIRTQHDVTPEEVESIEVIASEGAADCLQYPSPSTGVEARFSMPYVIARVVADGQIGLTAFEDNSIDEETIHGLQQNVHFHVDDEFPYNSHRTVVKVETTDGDILSFTQETPPGSVDNPLTDEELRWKFDECIDYSPLNVGKDKLFNRLSNLSEQTSIQRILGPIHNT